MLDAIDTIGPVNFDDKTVIDINNPVPGYQNNDFRVTTYDGLSLSEAIAAKLTEAHVVKVSNMCQASVWKMDPPEFDGRRLVTMICGENKDALTKTATLVEAVGSVPKPIGPLFYARNLEHAAALVIIQLLRGADMPTVLNLIKP